MAALPQQALTFNDVFEEADADEPQQQTVQHIRANSSIMQLKKILGEPRHGIPSFSSLPIDPPKAVASVH